MRDKLLMKRGPLVDIKQACYNKQHLSYLVGYSVRNRLGKYQSRQIELSQNIALKIYIWFLFSQSDYSTIKPVTGVVMRIIL